MLPYRLKNRFQRWQFELACSSRVLASRPISTSPAPLSLVSMVSHQDVTMYLAAVKSFVRFVGMPLRVVALSDSSLTPADHARLREHIQGIEFRTYSDVPAAPDCPSGNCWERLLLISDLVRDSYVVQLDADTLTFREVTEVREAIRNNQSFTLLGDGSHPAIESFAEASARYGGKSSAHVQVLCERAMGSVEERDRYKYVRGNAGFVGFAKGSIDRDFVSQLSRVMRAAVGARWEEWGTEQVTSNLVIANTPGSVLLPFPRYVSYWDHPSVNYDECAFVHFIGAKRFEHGYYARRIRDLMV